MGSDGVKIIPEMGEAYRLLLGLTPDQRGAVLCWFCRSCNSEVPPGATCRCEEDALIFGEGEPERLGVIVSKERPAKP